MEGLGFRANPKPQAPARQARSCRLGQQLTATIGAAPRGLGRDGDWGIGGLGVSGFGGLGFRV